MAIMAIGERIHFFRTLRGMTQKYLGMALGFPEKSADVRLAQYENGSRTPKADVTTALADVLDVSPKALDVPDIDSYHRADAYVFYLRGQIRILRSAKVTARCICAFASKKDAMQQSFTGCFPHGVLLPPD